MPRQSDDRPTPPRGPFFRPLRIHEVPEKNGVDRRIEATTDECKAIAADAGLPAVGALSAVLHIARRDGGRFTIRGALEATITQICVASLEPFEETLHQTVEITFALPASRNASARAVVIDIDEADDPPDLIVDNTIDLGAVSLEFLTLARDFYPKKPGVHFTDVLIGENDQPEPSTFAVLERLKDQS